VTSQAHDAVRLDGEEWSLAAVAGTGLSSISDHAIEPGMPMTTACHRGHYCVYAVEGDGLVLSELRLPSSAKVAGRALAAGDPLLGGTVVEVERERASWMGERFVVRDLRWHVPFTGTLLLARDVVSYGPHIGFWPAWHFGRVVELAVDAGVVTGRRDRSEEMAETRRAIEEGEREHPDGPRDDVRGWIARTFGLGYDRSVPRPPPPRPPER
jgi:hypothetical protein